MFSKSIVSNYSAKQYKIMRLYLDKIINPIFESSLHRNIYKNMDQVA